ncbi:MAG: Rieske 2Fe-2S domain-containing protein, partial [Bacteroidota bacterium]
MAYLFYSAKNNIYVSVQYRFKNQDMVKPDIPFIHEDIRAAQTLPGAFYRDPMAYEAMRSGLFNSNWNFLGHTGLLPEDGYAYPVTLLEDCLNEPLILTRDKDSQIRCMSNVCTHR